MAAAAAAAAAAGSASAVSRPCPTARRCRGGPRRPRATRAGTAFASAVSSGRSPSDAVSLPLIDGPCVWHGPELRAAPELWTHRLTASESAELDAALAYFDKLKPSCVDSGVSYEDRVGRRKEEIESLQEALRILNGEDIA